MLWPLSRKDVTSARVQQGPAKVRATDSHINSAGRYVVLSGASGQPSRTTHLIRMAEALRRLEGGPGLLMAGLSIDLRAGQSQRSWRCTAEPGGTRGGEAV